MPRKQDRWTSTQKVMSYLYAHSGEDCTVEEIADEVGMPQGTVSPILSRFKDLELVEHNSPYWRLPSDTHSEYLGHELFQNGWEDFRACLKDAPNQLNETALEELEAKEAESQSANRQQRQRQ